MCAVILAVLMLLTTLAPVTVNAATAESPYCRISYDAAVGCNTVKYYSYVGGKAKYDASRLVKFYNGQLLLGTSNTLVTSKHKDGTNPAWTPDGSYLIWQETDDSCWARNYSTGVNQKIATNVLSVGLNAETMAETVSLANGTSSKVDDLIKGATATPTPTATTNPTASPAASATVSPTASPVVTASPTATATTPPAATVAPKPTTPVANRVEEWTDSANREHFTFNSNEVIVDGSDVYLNDFKISELCDSGVRYIGVDVQNRVYLYEDSSASLYRFSPENVFVPEKIKFGEGCTLKSVTTDEASRYLIEIVTSIGKFTPAQLVADKDWYPNTSYAINKAGYCTYYLAETDTQYKLTLSNGDLYLGTKKIQSGITRKSESYGFKNDTIYCVRGSLMYGSTLSNPTKWVLLHQNVAKLNYSTKNGMVTSFKRLSTKNDYVSNSSKKATWFLSKVPVHTISINKSGTKVYLDGKCIASLTKKQVKKFGKFTKVGFTERGKIVYANKKYSYEASVSTPKSVKKSTKKISHGTLGFASIK